MNNSHSLACDPSVTTKLVLVMAQNYLLNTDALKKWWQGTKIFFTCEKQYYTSPTGQVLQPFNNKQLCTIINSPLSSYFRHKIIIIKGHAHLCNTEIPFFPSSPPEGSNIVLLMFFLIKFLIVRVRIRVRVVFDVSQGSGDNGPSSIWTKSHNHLSPTNNNYLQVAYIPSELRVYFVILLNTHAAIYKFISY